MSVVFCDTNIILNEKFSFSDYSKVYISIVSIEEIDHLKNSETKGYLARLATRKIQSADNVEIILDRCFHRASRFMEHKNDNIILDQAYKVWGDNKEDFLFLCDDYNLLIKAKTLGLPYQMFEFKKKETDIYTGIRTLSLTEQEYTNLLENPSLYNFHPNEYVIINNTTLNDKFLFTWNGRYLDEVKTKPISNKYVNKINPLDFYQKAFIHMLQNKDVKIKITDSIYGAGKTYLMVHWALQMLEKEKVNKLYFIKSDSPPKNRKEFPAIPGGVVEKFEPYLGVLCDVTSEDNVTDILLRNNKLDILPIQFAKGRSLRKSIWYINECQDFTPSEMERLLSRVGEDTIVLLDGSTKQIDNKYCVNRNGLTVSSNNFRDEIIAAQVNMVEDYRSEVSKLVSQMDWSD